MAEASGYDKMVSGQSYTSPDWDLIGMQTAALRKLVAFNSLPPGSIPEGMEILKGLLGKIGEGTVVFGPLTYEYGIHIELGERVLINFDCVFMDGARVSIGDDTLVAPRVQFVTATHEPNDLDRTWFDAVGNRLGSHTLNKAITVGNRCWIGMSSIILPGVTIGDDTTIGAGSVVTKSIPAGVVAAGNPCRVIRENTRR